MKCLIIMPFATQFDAVHEVIKQSVVDAMRQMDNVRTLRLDEIRTAGNITHQLIEALQGANFYIADLTGQNANVMWEAGFAASFGRPVIYICQSADPLPFDVKDERIVRYNRRKLDATLYRPLMAAVRQTLSTYPPTKQRIVVTGTGAVLPQRVAMLLSTILKPYLGTQSRWYSGANGNTDENAIELLAKSGEQIYPVFDRVYKVTPYARTLIKAHGLVIFDAEKEMDMEMNLLATSPMPAITPGIPTTAKLASWDSAMVEFFLQRSDLMVLLGDPTEGRTKTLVREAEIRHHPYLLVFP